MDENSLKDELKNISEAVAEFAAASEKSAEKAEQAHAAVKDFASQMLEVKTLADQKLKNQKKGKPIKEYLDDYWYFSGKASDINRNLSIAGLAIIWLLLKDTDILSKVGNSVTLVQANIPKGLLLPFLCLIISLTLDLLHYVSGSAIWGMFHKRKMLKWEANTISDEQASNIEAPAFLRGIVNFFFISKFVPTILAYSLLIIFLKDKLHFS